MHRFKASHRFPDCFNVIASRIFASVTIAACFGAFRCARFRLRDGDKNHAGSVALVEWLGLFAHAAISIRACVLGKIDVRADVTVWGSQSSARVSIATPVALCASRTAKGEHVTMPDTAKGSMP